MKTVVADFRENADELLQALHEDHGFEVIRKQLSSGYYLIEPDTTVERKTCANFAITSYYKNHKSQEEYEKKH